MLITRENVLHLYPAPKLARSFPLISKASSKLIDFKSIVIQVDLVLASCYFVNFQKLLIYPIVRGCFLCTKSWHSRLIFIGQQHRQHLAWWSIQIQSIATRSTATVLLTIPISSGELQILSLLVHSTLHSIIFLCIYIWW